MVVVLVKTVIAISLVLLLGADKKKPKLDLGLNVDVGGNIPKGENLQKAKEKQVKTESSATTTDLSYQVVKIAHGKAFNYGPSGAVPTVALAEIPASGNPLTTDKFTTVVRVKCAQRVSASIELAVLDSRLNEIMTGGGTVYFRSDKSQESDYTLDWDPTPVRQAGEYTLNVKVAGNVVGTFPFRIIDKNAPKTGDAGH
jgi:hypothetical protein